ncbi:hypothetical protein HDG35_006494 [Paraburkholderia sp. JPY681]|nr:hypothetical protein [Paraburkholderia atlantica]
MTKGAIRSDLSSIATYPADAAGRCSMVASSLSRTVNLFLTDLTPSTDLAALAAREICQLSGTVPVSVTTPRLDLM